MASRRRPLLLKSHFTMNAAARAAPRENWDFSILEEP
jgi:hypothetical protein